MRLLHENEIDFILDLIDKGTKEIDLNADEAGPFLTPYMVQRTLDELHNTGLIEIKSVRIDYKQGSMLDGFLARYSKLIKAGKIEEAKTFAIQGDFSALNDTLKEVKTIPEIWEKIDIILKGKGYLVDSDFNKDLTQSIFVKLKVKPQLNDYLNSYLEAYKEDKLEKPPSPKDKYEKVSYFENEYYRYKKQREIFIDLLQKKLDIQNPQSIKIDIYKELPFEHINLTELLLCLEKEGIIKESKIEHTYGSLDENEFGRDELWLSVDENKIPKIPTTISKTIDTSPIKSVPFLFKESKSGYLKFYKQGPKIRIGNLTSRKYKLMAFLFDPLGVAKTTDAVFESIKTKKDRSDERLNDSYLAKDRKIEIIQFTMKELQKIKKLKGKIKLSFQQNNRMISLELSF